MSNKFRPACLTYGFRGAHYVRQLVLIFCWVFYYYFSLEGWQYTCSSPFNLSQSENIRSWPRSVLWNMVWNWEHSPIQSEIGERPCMCYCTVLHHSRWWACWKSASPQWGIQHKFRHGHIHHRLCICGQPWPISSHFLSWSSGRRLSCHLLAREGQERLWGCNCLQLRRHKCWNQPGVVHLISNPNAPQKSHGGGPPGLCIWPRHRSGDYKQACLDLPRSHHLRP